MDVKTLLERAIARHGHRGVAQTLGVCTRTVRRWQADGRIPDPAKVAEIKQHLLPPKPRAANEGAFRFADLFAGIGGMRMAFEKQGGTCVFTSEWDPHARRTYLANFDDGEDHRFEGDITKVAPGDIPDHDVLVAGFPCQPFSIAGVSKKNSLGRPHGFLDQTQGTLFFNVAKIIEAKLPKAFLLENVKNLVGHDRGRTLDTILKVLREDLGYEVSYRIINAKSFVPQHRERIIIIGFRDGDAFPWDEVDLPPIDKGPKLASVLHKEDRIRKSEERYMEVRQQRDRVKASYTLSDDLWDYLQAYAQKHRDRGNGFGCAVVRPDGTTRTLSARYYKDGSEILVHQGPGRNPRRLTPRECARLMGFDDEFRIPVSDTRAYKQFGNSVVVPAIAAVAKVIAKQLGTETQESTHDLAVRKARAA
jgi:DNA (cytosine-5)-methyltransferase 1